MSQTDLQYKKYHPKWYRTRKPIFWWMQKWSYVKFITRELTSVFVASYAVILLLHLRGLSHGAASYEALSEWLKTPVSITLHAIAFFFALFHSITWFNLAPSALVIKIGKYRLPDAAIAFANYAAWLVFSAALAWLILK